MPVSLAAWQKEFGEQLQTAKGAYKKFSAVEGRRTVENTLVVYDEIILQLSRATATARLFRNAHPDAGWRKAAVEATAQVDEFRNALSLDRKVHDALAQIAQIAIVPSDAKWYIECVLASYRRDGALQPASIRAEIAKVRTQLTALERQYGANLSANHRTFSLKVSDLDGVPADFLKRHSADAEGTIHVTNDTMDLQVLLARARNPEVRRQAALMRWNRGHPENERVVADLIRMRHQLAKICGFPNFAAYAADSRMVLTVERHRQFLQALERASEDAARRELAELVKFKAIEDSQGKPLAGEDVSYYQRIAREATFGAEIEGSREYFEYSIVKLSVLGTAATLFGIEFVPLENLTRWHPSVEAYEVKDGGRVIGRFYLDMHSRPNKFAGFQSSSLRAGVLGRQLPEVVLLCNFPNPADGSALMDRSQAEMFFHEFGHLLHSIFSGKQRWAGADTGVARDFDEAPSQLLEEWLRNPEVLVRFTRHYKTGQPMPLSLAKKLVLAGQFGKGIEARRTLALSWAMLDMHDDTEPRTDAKEVFRTHFQRLGLPFVEGSHMEETVTHVGARSYAATYYTYLWSLMIAKDLFTRFDPNDLLSPKIAGELRRKILEKGGTEPSGKLVQDFLGRPFNEKAYQHWLSSN
ncbi:MAG: hypothetical protein HY820_18350 [Acidobacteria bacterium]|nr:hypothetical protein [Acidobacteriota bacterium]